MRGGKVKHGSNTVLYTFLIAVAVVFINLISSQHYEVFDLTAKGDFSLSPQTRKVMGSLDEDIKVLAFIKPEQLGKAADLLDQYARISGKLKYETIDPNKKPGLAEKYNVDRYNVYVVETASGRRETITKLAEDELTNAIIRATSSEPKTIYVLEGHGERSMTDTNQQGWSSVKTALLQAAYKVEPLNWFTTGKIPDDADLIIIPGPKNDLQKIEIDRLREALEKGVSLFVAIDPPKLPNLQRILGEFGFGFHEDMILDPLSQQIGFEPLVATVSSYGTHPVSKEIKAATFFPVARSLELIEENKRSATLNVIASTAMQSWSETSLASIEKGVPEYMENEDLPGPRTVAASARWEIGPPPEKRKIGEKVKTGRMVVSGDSDFAANATLGLSANRDLLLNIVGWLIEEENRISIRAKSKGFNPVMFTGSQLKVIFWSVVVAMPLSVAVIGFTVGAKRRRS